MPTRYPAGVKELPEGGYCVVAVGGREVGIFNIAGEYYGLANRCPHQQGPLCRGLVSGTLQYEPGQGTVWANEGQIVACPWHGLEVHIPSGMPLAWRHRRVLTFPVISTPEGLVIEI